MAKIICGTEPVKEKIYEVTLYCPESKSFRMYPWFFECPICGTKDGIVEWNDKCKVCGLQTNWVEEDDPWKSEQAWDKTVKVLKELKQKVGPPQEEKYIRRIVLE